MDQYTATFPSLMDEFVCFYPDLRQILLLVIMHIIFLDWLKARYLMVNLVLSVESNEEFLSHCQDCRDSFRTQHTLISSGIAVT